MARNLLIMTLAWLVFIACLAKLGASDTTMIFGYVAWSVAAMAIVVWTAYDEYVNPGKYQSEESDSQFDPW